MEKTKKERPEKYNGKLSLYPLKFEEAIKDLLEVKSQKGNENGSRSNNQTKT